MPTDKGFKRLVRGRMQKTGESYTAARAQLRRIRPEPQSKNSKQTDLAAVAGMSDDSVKKATGCTWERWVRTLDAAGAYAWPHREMTAYIRKTFDTSSWWTQMVAVGYERIKGLRARGQKRDGAYAFTRSKTFSVPVATLYAAFENGRTRAKWLPGVKLTIRTATENRSMRVMWPDGTSVAIGFLAKGESKSQVALEQSKFATQADAAARKAFWSERLEVLGELLVSR